MTWRSLLLAGAFLAGWMTQGWRMGEQISDMQSEHAKAIRGAEERARKIEQGWHAVYEKVRQDAKNDAETFAADVAAERDNSQRLLGQINDLSRRPASCPSPPAGGASAETVSRMFAELLGELQGMAGAYAQEARSYRIAGLRCEVAHDLVADGE